MKEHTFARWLQQELTAARYSLLTLHEQRDKLLYIDGPALERDYMEKIGFFEETVIKEEIECEILKKKQQLIQTALNRRETIDEEAINAELERMRQQMLKEAAGTAAPQEYAELSDEEIDELQDIYHRLVKGFHPQMHPNLTDTHRHLFRKAQEAYRRRDLPALRLIYQMLVDADGVSLDELLAMLDPENEEESAKEQSPLAGYATDFTLAATLYPCFKPTAEEAAVREETEGYRQQADAVMVEMTETKRRFPYSAAEMLTDPSKIEVYRKELELRLHAAVQERERRTREIQAMMEGAAYHE